MRTPSDTSSKPSAIRLSASAGDPIAGNQNFLNAGPRGPLRSIRWLWRKLQTLSRRMRLSERRRTAVEPEVALLRDAEFRVAMSELHYPPIGPPKHAVPGGYPPRPSVTPGTNSSLGHPRTGPASRPDARSFGRSHLNGAQLHTVVTQTIPLSAPLSYDCVQAANGGQQQSPTQELLTCDKLSAAARLALRSDTGTFAAKQRSIKAQPLFAGRPSGRSPFWGFFFTVSHCSGTHAGDEGHA